MNYQTTIGLEVHVQLKTRSKMFCCCPVEFGAPANSHTCPTCLGLPGGMPVVNREAVRLTIVTGLMLRGKIADVTHFDRKNYFYPDLAKNYQVTQSQRPVCGGGMVVVPDFAYPNDAKKNTPEVDREIDLVRVHLEEDVAKNVHFETATGIDFNRAGIPLMEIVTGPEIASPDEAFAFLTALKQILVYGEVSDAEMEKGQLRCDANISVRPDDQRQLNPKTEIKNLNSVSAIRRALKFEVERQTATLERGEKLTQQTRGWDDNRGETFLQRVKESEHDYRYFPEPDLLPVNLAEVAGQIIAPEAPTAKRQRFVSDFGVTRYDAGVLVSDLELANYFEIAARTSKNPKTLANWILNDLQRVRSREGAAAGDLPVTPAGLNELIELVDTGTINGSQGKEVLAEMYRSGQGASAVVARREFVQLSDEEAIAALCDRVIAANPQPVRDFQEGNAASLNYLKGQVIRLSQGKANPRIAGEILARKLAT